MVILPRDIALLLYHDAEAIEADDEACLYLIQHAQDIVLGKTQWATESEIPAGKALTTVRRITLALAARVWSNPALLSNKSTGPLARSWINEHVTGLALLPDEIAELNALDATTDQSSSGGFWTVPTNTGRPMRVGTTVEYVGPGGGNISEGDLWWPYGEERLWY